jgi:phage-related protein
MTVWNGTATVAGTGDIAGSATVRNAGEAALAGTGGNVFAGTMRWLGTATLDGVGGTDFRGRKEYIVFSPDVGPTVGGYSKKIKPRVLENEFGDGYTQRAGDGLNRSRRQVQLSWAQLDLVVKEYIEEFMETYDDGDSFTYTLPDEAVARTWQFIEMDISSGDTPDWYNVQVSIKEVFDL